MRTLVALLLSLCSSLLFAQQQPGVPLPVSPSPVKIAKIRELIRVTGTAQVALDAMRHQMDTIKKMIPFPPKAQDDFAEGFLAAANVDDFIELIIPIYDKHFTEAELDGMIAFYKTPLGQKLIKELPAVATEAQQAGAVWGKDIGAKVGTRIGERVQAGDYGPWPPAGKADPQTSGADDFKPATPAPK